MPYIDISQYDYYIFDCDGVILDSNLLKIDAMGEALQKLNVSTSDVKRCCYYFAQNFGKSRFHHVEVFVSEYLDIADDHKADFTKQLLSLFSEQCQKLYLDACLTPGVIDFINTLDGKKFIASGSEQNELRAVFKQRGLDAYFSGVYGSPTGKAELVANIKQSMSSNETIMFGDALSDLQAAQSNKIDFIAYTPFSNVRQQLIEQTQAAGFRAIDSWSSLKYVE